MDNIKLITKCSTYDFEKLFKDTGRTWFDKRPYNLNIIGIRSKNKIKCTNVFDDCIIIDYHNNTYHTRKVYPITTKPGLYYLNHPANVYGTAILVPGQYIGAWELGKHKGKYEALVQKNPVKVYRDLNKDDYYDMNPETIDNGVFGINIHRSNEFVKSNLVDKWSAGCQVFASPKDYATFIGLCKKAAALYGNRFTYTLIDETELK